METFKPVTYLLSALRSLLSEGWEAGALLQRLAAIAGVGALSLAVAFTALRGRTARG